MPKAKKVEAAAEVEKVDAVAPAAEPVAEAKKVVKTSFDVLNSGGSVVRTYTVEAHGEDAGDKAAEYAKKINGSVA